MGRLAGARAEVVPHLGVLQDGQLRGPRREVHVAKPGDAGVDRLPRGGGHGPPDSGSGSGSGSGLGSG